jgi:hypothetical protein
MARALKSVNFSYVAEEDRILAAINPGDPQAWSCWLTRRVVLALLEPAEQFLARTSHLLQQAPADLRGELVTFERDFAIAKTAAAMSATPTEILKASARAAELAVRVTIARQTDSFRVELHGERGGAAGTFTRAELQRFLQMLKVEVVKAGWFGTLAESSGAAAAAPETGPKPVRH